jgi:glucose-6-phosphate 1-dehydrogenase
MAANNIPTVLVIFGATGDLMVKKIVPALFHLYTKEKLPKMFQIFGVARRPLTDDEFRNHVGKILIRHHVSKNDPRVASFFKYFFYHQGRFENIDDYHRLAKIMGRIDNEWKVCANKLFYLATPPQYNEGIFNNLHDSGLTIPCSPQEGWTRVIVEKPFGRNLLTAEKLDLLLAKLFKEEQIYRIDHYLAKEMLQNILSFRFTNNLLEESWNNKFIEKIEIRLLEKIGAEDRGAFYDGVGALRDVGQNHLLLMLALITMEHPQNFDPDTVRFHRAQLLKTLRVPHLDEIKKFTFRAQYDGYRKIDGVDPKSKTETYFKVRAFLDNPRWYGVPIIMESGKRLKNQVKEIVVTFKHTDPCLCPPGASHFKNKITFSLEPKEEIKIEFLAKKPGLEMEVEKKSFDWTYRIREKKAQYVEEYEKLLLDCIHGNQLLFLSTSEIKPMWKYIDPIFEAWQKNLVPLNSYKPGTNQILKVAGFNEVKLEKQGMTKKEIGVIGLGKMGSNLALQLLEKGWRVVGYNRSPDTTRELEKEGLTPAYSIRELVSKLSAPKIIYMLVPAGAATDETLTELIKHLKKNDVVVESANSNYRDTIRRGKAVGQKGINFIDVGISGGPAGARHGASLMVGGDKKTFDYLYPLFNEIAVPSGVQHFEGIGAGHFVKMVHNGIEYGMMQALAEGFAILAKANYKIDLTRAADIYNHGSVIESRLVNWLHEALQIYGRELKNISGTVVHTGEGAWTVQTARELKIKARVIDEALKFRINSEKNPSYIGKVLSALRNRFGGHSTK